MGKRRKSSCSKTQINGPSIHDLSIHDLPFEIGVQIFLKLPIKSIIVCKSVCKTWHRMISNEDFVKLHLAQSKTCTLMRDIHKSRFSRSLYLLEHEDVCNPDSGYCLCRAYDADKCENFRYNTGYCIRILYSPDKSKHFRFKPDHCLCRTYSADKCTHFRFNTRLTCKLKIPLCNAEDMLNKVDKDTDVIFHVKSKKSRTRHSIPVQSSFNHKYDLGGTCNGLLCLYKMNTSYSVVVCNPVTGEFIRLPECEGDDKGYSRFALGFSPKHNQYKVIRYSITDHRAAIHTLGSDSWRNLDISAIELAWVDSPAYFGRSLQWVDPPAYFGGSLHWVLNGEHIATLDLDEEQLRVDSIPPPPYNRHLAYVSLVVQEGRLYLYSKYSYVHVYVWVMDHDNGTSKTWTELFSIDVSELFCFKQLIYVLNKDAVVMFDDRNGEFIYFDHSKGLRFKQLKFQYAAAKPHFEAISFTPSFVSLKDVVMPGNVEVLTINSGCGKLKLLEETYPLCLRRSRK